MTSNQRHPTPPAEQEPAAPGAVPSGPDESQDPASAAFEQVLDRLREAVGDLRSSVDRATGDVAAVPQAIVELSDGIKAWASAIEQRLDSLPPTVVTAFRDATATQAQALPPMREDLSRLAKSLPGMQETLGQLAKAVPDTAVRGTVDELKVALTAASGDVKTLAQAMLDLNGGLREWSDRLEQRIAGLATALLQALRDLTLSQEAALSSVADEVAAATADMRRELGDQMHDTTRSLGSRLDGVREQLVESRELTGYLRDQTEDLDKVLGGLGDVPQRLEGVVAQALRRALTVRAGLMAEAEKVMTQVFAPIESRAQDLAASLEAASASVEEAKLDEDLRLMAVRQDELAARVDEIQDSIEAQLAEAEAQRRETALALAEAIDRAARGLEPGAVAALRSAPRTRASTRWPATPRTRLTTSPPAARRRASSAASRTPAPAEQAEAAQPEAAAEPAPSREPRRAAPAGRSATAAKQTAGGSGRRSGARVKGGLKSAAAKAKAAKPAARTAPKTSAAKTATKPRHAGAAAKTRKKAASKKAAAGRGKARAGKGAAAKTRTRQFIPL
ncbi:MAG TPA: hypothetical protein VNE62_10490 [Actinomycetota bacterium]|nr:hypothetical protein [Actinomycetota bacterium]